MSGWIIGLLVAALLAFALGRYVAGIVRLRGGLRRVANRDLRIPLMLELPRGLRAAERDLKAIADRVRELEDEASKERFGLTAVLASIFEGVFIVDRQMRIRLANPGLVGMFELNGDPSGRPVMETFRHHEIQGLVQQALSSGHPVRGEIAFDRGRAHRVLELSASPVALDERERGAVVVVHDITEIRGLERVRREFVANVSHELRTPLTIINGYIETLLDGGLDDRGEAQQALGVMFKHADRLKHLVDDLLTISQAESRSVPLAVEPVDLRVLWNRVIEQFGETIRERGAAVRIEADDAGAVLEGDPLKLEQVFFNLLDNALKYGVRTAGLEVRLAARRAGDEILIEVGDNGAGIPCEDQKHIFERFYRVHKHRSRDTGGTGLGLSIVKNVVQTHGGSVSVASVPGEGSTFHLRLPVRQGTDSSALAAA